MAYYEHIREKYGKGKERRTELREFDSIEATRVAVTNAKLYVDRAEGFFGIGKSMKDAEFVCDCSDIDDVMSSRGTAATSSRRSPTRPSSTRASTTSASSSATTSGPSTTSSTATARTAPS